MPEFEAAVARVKPTIFCVSKSNLRSSVDHNEVQIIGYKLISSKTIKNPPLDMSRVIVYLNNEVRGKVRPRGRFNGLWILFYL